MCLKVRVVLMKETLHGLTNNQNTNKNYKVIMNYAKKLGKHKIIK